MKTHLVREKIKELGGERGVIYMLEHLQEQVNEQKRTILEMGQQLLAMVNTLGNVVEGTVNMRRGMESALKRSGIMVESEDDGLDPSTHNIDIGKN